MNDLLKLAEGIRDTALRKRVVSVLKNPGKLSGKAFSKYGHCPLEEAPASTGFHHIYVGGLVDHVYAVARTCSAVAKVMDDVYGTAIDHDSLMAAALLHDIGKLWKMRKTDTGWEDTDVLLDHTMLWTSELYSRGFPEKIVHIVASHFGETGPTPPMTLEAMILHNADDFDARIGTIDQESLLKQIIAQVNDEQAD